MKTCIKCGSTEFSERGDCRPCKREYDKKYRKESAAKVSAAKKKCYEQSKDHYINKGKKYYIENSKEISEKGRLYREKNKDVISVKKAEYRLSNRESILSKEKESYNRNKKVFLARCKEYAARNKMKIAEKQRVYYLKNAASTKARARQWFIDNKEKSKARASEYYKNNPEVFHNSRVVRRERESTGKLSSGLISKLLKLQKGLCPCCKQPLGTDYHIDHILPLALGGTNTDNNIQLLRGTCNLQKHSKHPIDFMQSRGFLI